MSCECASGQVYEWKPTLISESGGVLDALYRQTIQLGFPVAAITVGNNSDISDFIVQPGGKIGNTSPIDPLKSIRVGARAPFLGPPLVDNTFQIQPDPRWLINKGYTNAISLNAHLVFWEKLPPVVPLGRPDVTWEYGNDGPYAATASLTVSDWLSRSRVLMPYYGRQGGIFSYSINNYDAGGFTLQLKLMARNVRDPKPNVSTFTNDNEHDDTVVASGVVAASGTEEAIYNLNGVYADFLYLSAIPSGSIPNARITAFMSFRD